MKSFGVSSPFIRLHELDYDRQQVFVDLYDLLDSMTLKEMPRDLDWVQVQG